MPKKLIAIEKLVEKWDLIKLHAMKESQGFFGDSSSFLVVDNLFKTLNINSTMSIKELVFAIQYLESIPVKISSKPTYLSFAKCLSKMHCRNLLSFDIPSLDKTPDFSVKENSPLHQFLIENHNLLLTYYERAYFHSQGEVPFSEVHYSPDQLLQSQSFYDLENTSQASELPDKSTVVGDIKRKGVTLNGAVVHPGNVNDARDPAILKAIESFAGDSLANPDSKANKIFNFGGQFLEAIFLQEFSNTTEFATGVSGLERGSVKGHINWTKESGSNQIYATINMKMLTCSYADPDNLSAPQIIYGMASDGSSLIELDNEDLFKVLNRCNAEVTGNTEGNVVPICELNGRIKLVPNENKTGYMLSTDQFKISYNTDELVSSNAYKFNLSI